MKNSITFRSIEPAQKKESYTASHTTSGIPIPKTKRIQLFSPEEWEEFTEEWASSIKPNYYKVMRCAGSGDEGLDVVGFITDETFEGGWDNYQCKHYKEPLTPTVIWVEIGKIIYYSYKGHFPPPKKHYFIGSKGVGTKLGKLLATPNKLKSECKKNWQKYCEKEISNSFTVSMNDDILEYFENFDFSIFSSKSVVDLINGHIHTPFHIVRFGGGFPTRPKPGEPPKDISITESRYIEQIYEAYSDYAGELINDVKSLEERPDLKADFLRQRERFFHAESLRNFSRDTVPSGTYEELQDDVYQGVIDTCELKYSDSLTRMRTTITTAGQISISSSPLAPVTKVKDKQGICHQLANDDRLIWVQGKDIEEH